MKYPGFTAVLLSLLFTASIALASCGGDSSESLVGLQATVEALQASKNSSLNPVATNTSVQTPVVIVKEVIKEVPKYVEIEKEVIVEIEKEVIVEKYIEVVVTATPTPVPVVPPTVTPIPSPTSTPTPPPIGSSSFNPVAAGSTLLTDDGLGITVMSVNEDAWPEIQAESSWNDPPKSGNKFRIIEVRVQVVNGHYDATNSISPYDFKAVGSSGIKFSVGGECGAVPNELNSTTMFQGAVIQGNLCVEVPETETDLQIYYESGYDSQKYWSKAVQPSSIELLRNVSPEVITDPTVNIGTRRTNPALAGWTLLTDNGLGITVTSINSDAWPEVLAANSYNDPPKSGNNYRMIEVRIQVVDGYFNEGITISHYDFQVVGSSAIWAGSCGLYPVLPNPISATIYQGAVIQGNLCVEVPETETDLLLYYQSSSDSPQFWSKIEEPYSMEALRNVSSKVVTDSSVNIGTRRTNPVLEGSTLLTDDGLGITVMSVNEDAWPEIQAESSWNDPPKSGNKFRIIEVRVQVVNGHYDATNSISPYDFKAVGSSGIKFSVGGECGAVPNELNSTTMFQGAVIQGNLCVEVPETETDLQIYYESGYDSQKYWSKAVQPSSIELLRNVSPEVITDPTVNIGTRRTNPALAGWTLLTDNGLGITVTSINSDAWPEVLAANSYNDPPKIGNRFLMVRVEIENIGATSGQTNVSNYDFELVGSNAIWAGSCGLYPVLADELDVSPIKGQKMSGDLCFEVGDNETDFILNFDTYWLTLGSGADK